MGGFSEFDLHRWVRVLGCGGVVCIVCAQNFQGPAWNRVCPITDGQQVIDSLDFDDQELDECIYILMAFFLFFRFIGFLALYVRAHK